MPRDVATERIPLTPTTHAIVGSAIASLMPAYPWVGLSLAFASHFLLEALPHWDYPIPFSSINPEVGARMKYDGALFADLFTIGGDAALGIVVAVIACFPLAGIAMSDRCATAAEIASCLSFQKMKLYGGGYWSSGSNASSGYLPSRYRAVQSLCQHVPSSTVRRARLVR